MNEPPDLLTGGRYIAQSPFPPRVTHNPPPELRQLAPFTLPKYINTIGGENRRVAQENRDRWTPPRHVPLATPPSIDWPEDDERLASGLKHKFLFPNDPEKRERMKDLEGEKEALSRYFLHVSGQRLEASMGLMGPSSQGRLRFYLDLEKEILMDKEEVTREVEALFLEAGPLERFRYVHLENDGGCEQLSRFLRMGWPVIGEDEPEVIAAYGELFERCREEREIGKKRLEEGMKRDKRRLEGMGIRYALDTASIG